MAQTKTCCERLFADCCCIKYSALLKLDFILLILHLLAAFILLNQYMLGPVLFIRLPRVLFGLIGRMCTKQTTAKDKAVKMGCCGKSWLFLEQWFRILSTIGMMALSIIIQIQFISNDFCPKYDEGEDRHSCVLYLIVIMVILILLNTIVDLTMWRVCRTFYLDNDQQAE